VSTDVGIPTKRAIGEVTQSIWAGPVGPTWILLDFLQDVRYELSPQTFFGKLLLQAG
jgi:hypothetical protein